MRDDCLHIKEKIYIFGYIIVYRTQILYNIKLNGMTLLLRYIVRKSFIRVYYKFMYNIKIRKLNRCLGKKQNYKTLRTYNRNAKGSQNVQKECLL